MMVGHIPAGVADVDDDETVVCVVIQHDSLQNFPAGPCF
jgi:hypothetical protein